MVQPIKNYASIEIEDLRKIRGYPILSLMRGRKKIPELPGIYIWRYWPGLASVDKDSFLRTWGRWRDTQPQFEETVNNSRVSVSIRRTPFGSAHSDVGVFGFNENNDKAKNLLKIIENDFEARQMLAYTIESLLSAVPPLYIGKADNLQRRLNDHFDQQSSTVIKCLREAGISLDDVYVSFILDPVSDFVESSVTTALEEIIQRMANPPLTKRFG